MLFYKDSDTSDPFYHIYSSPDWLFPYQRPLRDFPIIIDLEVTNYCNLDCIFCSRQLIQEKLGMMEFDVYRRVVDEVAEHPCALRTSGWGEPLIHPDIVKQVAYAHGKGVLTKIYTNGTMLNQSLMTGFIKAGLDELQFSMQGLNKEQFKAMRRKTNYETFRRKVSLARQMREQAGGTRPFLSILTSILLGDLESASVEDFKTEWLPLVDKIAIDLTSFNFVRGVERVQEYLPRQGLPKQHRPCVDAALKLSVHWDGGIKICNNDYGDDPYYSLGNVRDMTIQEAWLSKRMARHRDLVGRQLRHGELPLCRHCFPNTDKYDYLKEQATNEQA